MNDVDPALAWAEGEKRSRRLRIAVALAVLVAAAAGVIALVVAYREVDFPDIERPLLWRVTSPKGETGYLFGTMHVGYGIEELPAAVLEAQSSSRVTVLESDLLREAPAGTRLIPRPDRLRSGEWKQLSELSGRSIDDLQRLDTLHLLGAALVAVAPRPREAMDLGLQKRAARLGKRVEFLLQEAGEGEPTLEVMPEETSIAGVRQVLADPDRVRKYLQSMINAYGRGEGPAGGGLPIEGVLNEAWIDPIDDYFGKGGAFVAIGAAHLGGAHSIRAWLERRGHRVERWPW